MKSHFEASSEFKYYEINDVVLREHWSRILDLEHQAYYSALKALKPLGLLDARIINGKRVLDVGAGESHLSVALANTFQPEIVYAVDLIPKQIWAAAYRYHDSTEAATGRLKFVVATALGLPFGDSGFDIVMCNLFYHHLPDASKPVFAQELFRLLRPGGWFVCREPNNLISWLFGERKTSENERPFPASMLRRQLHTAGFSEVQSYYFWTRFETRILGPLSPSYVVQARVSAKNALPTSGYLTFRRTLCRTSIPGLLADPICLEKSEVAKQIATIAQCIPDVTKPTIANSNGG